MDLRRTGIRLEPDPARVLLRPFDIAVDARVERIIARVMSMDDAAAEDRLVEVLRRFGDRHDRLREFLLERYEGIRRHLPTDHVPSESRRLLLGACFAQEYAFESAALFNPSMVEHPDQSGLAPGAKRFIVSLRATGEGHISSITFRGGVLSADGEIHIDRPSRSVASPSAVPSALFEKALFHRKLRELGVNGPLTDQTMTALGERFTLEDLARALRSVIDAQRDRRLEFEPIAHTMLVLARANYEIQFDPGTELSRRVIFPSSPTETNGIEDARFVRFIDDDGVVRYYATYTAYDGRATLPQMLETDDFLHFRISTLNGPEVQNKGFALFPRRINGRYAMLSRQDNECLYLMYSDQPHFWYARELVARPTYPWEFIQIGNCGSPIETEAGWLVLTHGVGPMRGYSMGAFLLDLENPARLIGRLSTPLIEPDDHEREGYVPNVVYSCGGMVHGSTLVIPYAMSDHSSTFATVPLAEVLAAMTRP